MKKIWAAASAHFQTHSRLSSISENPNIYDLVISDARMPRMTGFELARRIKDVKPDVKVIIMTASEINRLEFENVLPSTKIDGFVTKPATLKVVCVAIERCLG